MPSYSKAQFHIFRIKIYLEPSKLYFSVKFSTVEEVQ